MILTKINFERFTAFRKLSVQFSPGVNIFIGANGTGKTHILKAAYAACDVSKTERSFPEKINNVFLPSGKNLGRLVYRTQGSSRASLEVFQKHSTKLRVSFSNHTSHPEDAKVTGLKEWCDSPMESAYIPVKEMLANAPGFRSLYANRDIHFEEVYADIIDRAYLPAQKGAANQSRKELLTVLERAIEVKVLKEQEEFFLKNSQGELEFTLLAEGMRKLGLLWLLIQNGTLLEGSVLFWDEPEANLNPSIIGLLVEMILKLQRLGVQVFIATHNYVLLKEFDLRSEEKDEVSYHSLYREDERDEKTIEKIIKVHTSNDYLDIHPNTISDTYINLYDRQMRQALNAEQQRGKHK